MSKNKEPIERKKLIERLKDELTLNPYCKITLGHYELRLFLELLEKEGRVRKLESKLIIVSSRLAHIERSFLTHPDCEDNSEFQDRANEIREMRSGIDKLLNN